MEIMEIGLKNSAGAVWDWDVLHLFTPASRGVAAHTAGLFRSVRGAKGGFSPVGALQAKKFQ